MRYDNLGSEINLTNPKKLMKNKLQLRASVANTLSGRIRVPGDKSTSHRSLIFGALAIGTTHVSGMLEAEDVMATAEALKKMGVNIQKNGGIWQITGTGVGGLQKPTEPLDFGNAGTGSRLMMGVLASHNFSAKFTGDASLCSRPMGRVTDPLGEIGAHIYGDNNGMMPFTFSGSDNPLPIEYTLPMASAQVKSAILLAGLNVEGKTIIHEPIATRNHTEKMMKHFGADIEVFKSQDGGGNIIILNGPAQLYAKDVIVPADPSSAAFPIVAALITPGADILVEAVMLNPTRSGLIDVLRQMGGNIEFINEREEGGENVADLRVKYSKLKSVTVPAEHSSSMIDEYPILAVAASYAEGETKMLGLEELRVKESDRLAIVAKGLADNGVICKEGEDWLTVTGGKVKGGGFIDTKLDHRIAMSFLVMGLNAQYPIVIDDCSVILTSFPSFIEDMKKLGADFN